MSAALMPADHNPYADTEASRHACECAWVASLDAEHRHAYLRGGEFDGVKLKGVLARRGEAALQRIEAGIAAGAAS